jgi:hypothetical protein
MKIFYCILFLFSSAFAFSQDIKFYEGGWLGEIEEGSFTFTVTLKQVNGDKYIFAIKNKNASAEKDFTFKNGIADFTFDDNVSLTAYMDENKIEGFITSGIIMHHLTFLKRNDEYIAEWNLLASKRFAKGIFSEYRKCCRR